MSITALLHLIPTQSQVAAVLDGATESSDSDDSSDKARPLLDWAAITAMVNFNSYADVGEDAAIVMCR